MDRSPAWFQQLEQTLNEQVEAGARLLDILLEEKKALTGTSADELNRCGARKHAQLAQFEQLEQKRRLLCQSGGVGLQRPAMERFIDELPTATATPAVTQLRDTWKRLLQTASRCRDANETNGLIAQFKQRQLLQILGVLRGGNATTTYGATGTTALSGLHSRSIAQA